MPGVGVAVGLAWTAVGGDILHIETSLARGKGELALTGQLGEVMRESAQAAYTFLRAHASQLGVPVTFAKTYDVHVHVPEGAIPKDGPSAGITLATAVAWLAAGLAGLGLIAGLGGFSPLSSSIGISVANTVLGLCALGCVFGGIAQALALRRWLGGALALGRGWVLT